MTRPLGLIAYEGPSLIDGVTPIVMIITGIDGGSTNSKTGHMVQTHILVADALPMAALQTGLDKAICGDCKHRGDGAGNGRTCYVRIYQAQTGIIKAYHRGRYAAWLPEHDKHLAGKPIRFGSYGDPAAVPTVIWERLADLASLTTGYTHQWRTMPNISHVVMASADTAQDAIDAHQLGYRTFRVGIDGDVQSKGEVLCPASKEAGQKLQCADCGSCNGTQTGRKGSIFINLHGGTSVMANADKLKVRLIASA